MQHPVTIVGISVREGDHVRLDGHCDTIRNQETLAEHVNGYFRDLQGQVLALMPKDADGPPRLLLEPAKPIGDEPLWFPIDEIRRIEVFVPVDLDSLDMIYLGA